MVVCAEGKNEKAKLLRKGRRRVNLGREKILSGSRKKNKNHAEYWAKPKCTVREGKLSLTLTDISGWEKVNIVRHATKDGSGLV